MSKYASLFSDDNQDSSEGEEQDFVPYQMLLVDDEPNVLNALKRVFRKESYVINTASNADEALKYLSNNTCQLVISDFKMPGMNGAQFLQEAKKLYPQMIRIMLTGQADTDAVMAAIKDGAVYKFILKPWNDDDLRVTVALAFEQYELVKKNNELKKQNLNKAKEISSLVKLNVTNKSQLAIMLNKKGLLTDKQVQEVHKLQQIKKKPIIKSLLDRDWVDESLVRKILQKDMLMDEIDLREAKIDPEVSSLLPAAFCDYHLVMPVAADDHSLTLAMADPLDTGLTDDLRFIIGVEVRSVLASSTSIKDKIHDTYEDAALEEIESFMSNSDPFEGIEVVIDDDDELSLEDLLHSTEEPPAIRLVNAIILEAIRLKSSDIHIHPKTKHIVIRYRMDGVLHDKIHIPLSMHMALVSRIKVMAELDITERRRPQDGRITIKTPMRVVDLRLSTLPTINGEKIVMRLLDRNASLQGLDELGLSVPNLMKIHNLVTRPQGIILSTGPTGSGKTTTLYAMMQHNLTSEKNYVTIEDPVEYFMDSASQVMVKEKIGFDFATALRSILRQDPDVILLGEVRDFETAEVAFHAALTGHLVYSTLHTNSAITTVTRLIDYGLKPHVIAAALQAVVAQRLVRKICSHCKESCTVSQEILHQLGEVFSSSTINYYSGKGCTRCNNTGYSGRAAIYEILIPSFEMLDLISTNASFIELAQQAQKEGMVTLIEDARDKVDQGITSAEEVLRVLGSQVIA